MPLPMAKEKKIIKKIFRHKYESYFLGQYPCHDFIGSSQYFTLSKKGEFRNEYMCAEVEKVMKIFNARFELYKIKHGARLWNR